MGSRYRPVVSPIAPLAGLQLVQTNFGENRAKLTVRIFHRCFLRTRPGKSCNTVASCPASRRRTSRASARLPTAPTRFSSCSLLTVCARRALSHRPPARNDDTPPPINRVSRSPGVAKDERACVFGGGGVRCYLRGLTNLTLFWKIDYHDERCEFGSEDPSDPTRTTRVLTLMLSSEY